MRILYTFFLLFLIVTSCKDVNNNNQTAVIEGANVFTKVDIEFLHQDSTSIRAIEVANDAVMYAGSNGHYGIYEMNLDQTKSTDAAMASQFKVTNKGRIDFLGKNPAFRSIASTSKAFFILSIENPALLYRYDRTTNQVSLVYTEQEEGVFYDAMTFWNEEEGIAIGDSVNGCLSVIITRDGGTSWGKLDCGSLPNQLEKEGAFAASNTNIKTIRDETWIITGGGTSRMYYSANKGFSWSIYNLPVAQGKDTQGAYTMDFYDNKTGIIYGGDYTTPEDNVDNIATTSDGGKSWVITASGENNGYKSCVQYVPNSNGKEIIAAGFTGISYSSDSGASWKQLSDAPFLTVRFANDSTAYAGGKNALARLNFKR
ncbi:oxidoreductase [Dokdonia sp. PRO95]|uniref:WD40/YVTN/BNR-like repeat-containing protein n=1 Tax=Dokdonia sp. PRO95 TaxID=1239415 RepID=UPI0005571553|nr:oxidoreductase [Dokdonia sp. PRO95]